MRPDQAVAFVERIRSCTGVYPGIYSGEYHLAQVLNSARVTPAQRQYTHQLLALGCKLLERAACNGAVELLGYVAILRGR